MVVVIVRPVRLIRERIKPTEFSRGTRAPQRASRMLVQRTSDLWSRSKKRSEARGQTPEKDPLLSPFHPLSFPHFVDERYGGDHMALPYVRTIALMSDYRLVVRLGRPRRQRSTGFSMAFLPPFDRTMDTVYRLTLPAADSL